MKPGEIRAIIIDDEEISLGALAEKVRTHCPDISILKCYLKPESALQELAFTRPDLVFLDIEMPKMNGFTFLRECVRPEFEVIFTTAYSQYAIDALRISALDFLLKPIDVQELKTAVQRMRERMSNRDYRPGQVEEQFQLFQQYQQPFTRLGKIALPVLNGLEFVHADQIIKVEAENVYSVFFLSGGKKMVACMTLKEVEAMLEKFGFCRVHKSFIVNLKYIARYIRGEGGTVVLSDGSEVEVSRRSKSEFLRKILGK